MANQNTPSVPEQEQDSNALRQIRLDKLRQRQADGNDPFTITKYDVTAKAASIKADYEVTEAKFKEEAGEDEEALQAKLDTLKEQPISIAGRIMSWRDMGRANFIDVRDSTDRIQVYVRMNDIGKENFKEFKKWDIGDIVGVKGFVFRTRKGEISIHATEITMLSKSLLPLPEKWHGLKDQDTRYRQRYLDLIVNPNVKQTFVTRSQIVREIRAYLDGIGYLEVETPVLLPLQIAAAARPFVTHHNTLDMDMFLRIETELNLKKLIVGGFDRVYEVGRIFRNEGMDPSHNPEFTTLECYEAFGDFNTMMDLTEKIVTTCAEKVLGTLKIQYEGTEIDLTGPWPRMSMIDAVKKYSIIYADPPWRYKVYSKKGLGRSAESHYPTMELEDIRALPVGTLAADDCVLFLWTTIPLLHDCFSVMRAWGFSYKTVAFVWIKQNRKSDSLFWGMGHWTRANAEFCMLATKGHPKRRSAGVHQVILSHIEEHSKKPEEARRRIVELMGDLPRIELFARQKTDGWDAWGNEVVCDVALTGGEINVG